MENHTNSTVLITGCSTGFGRAIAERFLAQGWNVVATMRSPGASPFEANERLLVAALDVTDAKSVEAALAAATARFGRVDVVVNNAGIGLFAPFEATSEDRIRSVFETNVFGLMAVTRAVVPRMRERGSGTIVNVTSSVTFSPLALVASYAASKCAVEGLSEGLAHELAPFGVRVRLVEPGLAPTTAFAENAGGVDPASMPAPYADLAGRMLGTMRSYSLPFTTEADVAEAVYAAATDEGERLRYPAGGDAAAIADLRRTLPEQTFSARVRAIFGGDAAV